MLGLRFFEEYFLKIFFFASTTEYVPNFKDPTPTLL